MFREQCLGKTTNQYLIGWESEMSNQNHTFTDEYKQYEITTLVLSRQSGWIIEVTIAKATITNSVLCDRNIYYKTIDEAREAGKTFAKSYIDSKAQILSLKVEETLSPELQEWLDSRARAFRIKSAIREDGGHMSLDPTFVDPGYLEEPMRTEAIEYLRIHEPINNASISFEAKKNHAGPLSWP